MIHLILVILEQTMLHMPLMLGAYISFSLLKVPDLSIETAYINGAILGAYTSDALAQMPAGFALIFILSASLIGGALVGAVSSILTKKGRFPHLLSSIVTFGLFHGINQCIAPAYYSLSAPNPLQFLYAIPSYPELIALIVIGCVCISVIALVLRSQLGYSFAIYGNNPCFFGNYGISTAYVFISGIMIANACAGLSGYLFAQSNNFFELNMGLGKALLCITALVLGKSMTLSHRPITLLVPLIGTTAYFSVQQLLIKSGFNLKYFTAVQAFLVMGILLYTYRTKSPRAMSDNLGI